MCNPYTTYTVTVLKWQLYTTYTVPALQWQSYTTYTVTVLKWQAYTTNTVNVLQWHIYTTNTVNVFKWHLYTSYTVTVLKWHSYTTYTGTVLNCYVQMTTLYNLVTHWLCQTDPKLCTIFLCRTYSLVLERKVLRTYAIPEYISMLQCNTRVHQYVLIVPYMKYPYSAHPFSMTLSCSECDDGLINSDQRLIVEARHPGHREADLDYSWKLYIVADGSAPAPGKALT